MFKGHEMENHGDPISGATPRQDRVPERNDTGSRVAAYREAVQRVRSASRAEKVRLALGGTKEERAAILI